MIGDHILKQQLLALIGQCYRNPSILITDWQASPLEISGFVCINHSKPAVSFIPPKEKRFEIWSFMMHLLNARRAGSAPASCPKTSCTLHVKHERAETVAFLLVYIHRMEFGFICSVVRSLKTRRTFEYLVCTSVRKAK